MMELVTFSRSDEDKGSWIFEIKAADRELADLLKRICGADAVSHSQTTKRETSPRPGRAAARTSSPPVISAGKKRKYTKSSNFWKKNPKRLEKEEEYMKKARAELGQDKTRFEDD